jgi:hypothetical protein
MTQNRQIREQKESEYEKTRRLLSLFDRRYQHQYVSKKVIDIATSQKQQSQLQQ